MTQKLGSQEVCVYTHTHVTCSHPDKQQLLQNKTNAEWKAGRLDSSYDAKQRQDRVEETLKPFVDCFGVSTVPSEWLL